MNFGRALREIRKDRGISQKNLARLIGKNSSYISLIENGRRKPSMSVLEAISSTLKVPVYLFALIATDEHELQGISVGQAQNLGTSLLKYTKDFYV